MADKNFGVKQINLIGASGVPTIESPNNLNLNAINVAISTDLSIGGKINSNVYIGDGYSLGISTTNATSRLTVVGNGRFTGVVTASSFSGNLTGVAEYTSEWTLGADGVSNYTFSGPGFTGGETDPTIYLVRGEKYKFTNNMGAHPFRIQSTPNGSVGTQYNDGITNNDVSNGTLIWNVQFDSPSVLYYQCTAHSNMGGTIYIIDRGGDTYWEKTYAGLSTTSSVGIGTTNPQGTLQVGTGVTIYGNTGIVSATTFYGNLVGSITNATNLTGGTASASSLNVSGIATISQGRIQADASSNLRFGNLPAGSGSGRNIAIGDQVLVSLSGGQGRNIGIGELSYYDTTTGQYNIGIGERSGQKVSTGSYNVILGSYDGNSGNLDIRTSSNNVVIADGQGNIRQYINSSGNVGIKTTVVTEALTVVGFVSATGYYGQMSASQLTGALPAIDGSALINVVGSGSGIVLKDDGSPVGTAGTIDFGSNLSVSFASGIATVSGASSVSLATTAYGLAGTPNISVSNVLAGIITASSLSLSGIITASQTGNVGATLKSTTSEAYLVVDSATSYTSYLDFKENGVIKSNIAYSPSNGWGLELNSAVNSNVVIAVSNTPALGNGRVGIGTTNPTSKFTVQGNSRFIGVVTATSFSGSGSGLTNLPASQLTGSLPAIDGSALLNVTAAGTGIAVRDNSTNVGSATTIDFGDNLSVTFGAGIATVTASGGSLQGRVIVSGATTSIPNLGIGNTEIAGFKSYSLMKVGLSTAGWLRIYTDSASRANDASRSIGEDPAPGSGVIAEVVTTGISTSQIISPFVVGGNLDDPFTNQIHIAVTNLSGTTQAITATLTILQLEA